MRDDWDEQFKAWKATKEIKKIKSSVIGGIYSPLPTHPSPTKRTLEEHKHYPYPKYSVKKVALTVLSLLILAAIFYYVINNFSSKYLTAGIIALGIISVLFLVLAFGHNLYEKMIPKAHPFIIMLAGYAILIINMLLSPNYYSLEYAFIAFLVISVLFYDFRIDSRFLILPAILLLGYIPFLLIGKQNILAENVAVYVFYFLVVGVATQLFQYSKDHKLSIDFDSFMSELLEITPWMALINLTGVIAVITIILNRFYEIQLLRSTALYLFVVMIVLYGISYISKESPQSYLN